MEAVCGEPDRPKLTDKDTIMLADFTGQSENGSLNARGAAIAFSAFPTPTLHCATDLVATHSRTDTMSPSLKTPGNHTPAHHSTGGHMKRVAVCAVLILAAAALSTVHVSAEDPLVGTWKTNIEKSKYSPGPPPKGPNTQKIEAVENGLRIVADGVNAKGEKTHNEYTLKYDGKDYPQNPTVDGKSSADAPDTISGRAIDEHTREITMKRKGVVILTVKDVLSKDGKTRTGTVTGKNAEGQAVNNVVVWEKQ